MTLGAVIGPAARAAAPETPNDRIRKVLDTYRTSRSGQIVTFDRCDIAIADAHATAYCRGAIGYIRGASEVQPPSLAMTWMFDLTEQSGQWRIVNTRAR